MKQLTKAATRVSDVCLILLVVAAAALAQNPSSGSPPKNAPAASTKPAQAKPTTVPTIGDNFAKQALRALRAIAGDRTLPHVEGNGLLVNRLTQNAIDDADVEARTQRETTAVAALNKLYTQHLLNNLHRKAVAMEIAAKATEKQWTEEDAMRFGETVAPVVLKALDQKENACSADLERLFRARTFAEPKSCGALDADDGDVSDNGPPSSRSVRNSMSDDIPVNHNQHATSRQVSGIGRVNASATERPQLSLETAQGLLIKKVAPQYPPLARQARVHGTVLLQADISKDGSVETLSLISGHPMLVQSAIDAVKQWIYQPYTLSGSPVAVRTQIEINFSLSD